MTTLAFREKLLAAGHASGTDKVLIHNYDLKYARSLERFQDQKNFAMLEIGYGSGASIEFWKLVFPNVFVYCFDKDHEEEGANFSVKKVDQSDNNDLQSALNKIEHPISLVIDDGSHHPAHQLLTFSCLFNQLLLDGGTYIIEDVETSYWRSASLYGNLINYGLNDPWSTIEAFKVACDYVNRRFLSSEDKSLLEYRMMCIGLDPDAIVSIESLLFSQNLIIIEKSEEKHEVEAPYSNAGASKRF
jgi:hypothetical protein